MHCKIEPEAPEGFGGGGGGLFLFGFEMGG